MDLEESRFRATWKRFLEVLKVDHNCSLADVCRKQHTTLGDMSSWMSRRALNKLGKMWFVIIIMVLPTPERQPPLLRSLK